MTTSKCLTLTEELHLEQIGQLLWKTGIELSCTHSYLTDYVRGLWGENQTSSHLDYIWRLGATTGSVLIYAFPVDDTYRLNYFGRDAFDISFDLAGNIDLLRLEKPAMLNGRSVIGSYSITPSEISVSYNSIPYSTIPNSYGFVPAVLIKNKMASPLSLGESEFECLRDEIDSFSDSDAYVQTNADLFGGAILYTSRSRSELETANLTRSVDTSWSGTTKKTPPIKLRSIIDNYDPEQDAMGFIEPPDIPSTTMDYLLDRRSRIRTALGSVDESRLITDRLMLRQPEELNIALAFPLNTARRRSINYIDNGIVAAYRLMLLMAMSDGKIPVSDFRITWRYLGEIWRASSKDFLNRSIVARNLERLGISSIESLRWLFPDRTEEDLMAMLDGGFAYEFIAGIVDVAAKMGTEEAMAICQMYFNKELSTNNTNEQTTIS